MPNERCAVIRITVISSGGRNRLSTVTSRRRGAVAAAAATSVSAIGFGDAVKQVDLRVLNRLLLTRGPPDDHAVNHHAGPETEVQPPLILRSKTAGGGDLLYLASTVPLHLDAGADRAAVAPHSVERELNPVASWRHLIAIHQ